MIQTIGTNSGPSSLEQFRQDRFKKIDKDGDGKISKDELAASLPQNGKGPSVDQIFNKLDTNQDGYIDASEEKAASAQFHAHHHGGGADPAKLAADLFKRADSDQDGKISQDELTSALSQNSSKLDATQLFQTADSDGDGYISPTELQDALKTMAQSGQLGGNAMGGDCRYRGDGTAATTTTETANVKFSATA